MDQENNNRIVVKLKLPKMAEDEKEQTEEEQIEEKELTTKKSISSHYCAECKRSFSSGKALGGHMSSAHVQANKDLSLKKLKSMKSKNHPHLMGSAGEIICNICGKDFPSRKSIFGHMRCHPDRDWRGMEPPPLRRTKNNKTDSSMLEAEDPEDSIMESVEDLQQVVDLKEPPLKSWSVTGKRGRCALNQADDPEVEEELLNAVHQLVRIVNDAWDERNKVEDLRINSTHQELHELVINEQKIEDVPLEKLKNSEESGVVDYNDDDDEKSSVGGGLYVEKTDKNPGLKLEDDDEYDSGYEYKNSTLSTKRKQTDGAYKCRTGTPLKKHKLAMDFDQGASSFSGVKKKDSLGKFSCRICKKRFATHQALGGHRSSHNNFKISIHNTSDQNNHQEYSLKEEEEEKKINCASATTGTTNLANELGYSTIESDDQKISSEAAVDDGQAVSNARKGLAFDLNEMPPDDDEDYDI